MNLLIKAQCYLLSTIIILLFLTFPALSSEHYSLNIVVEDSNKEPLPGVQFSLVCVTECQKKLVLQPDGSSVITKACRFLTYNTVSDVRGKASIFDMPPGSYKLFAEMPGLKMASIMDVNIKPESQNVRVSLISAKINGPITITCVPPVIMTPEEQALWEKNKELIIDDSPSSCFEDCPCAFIESCK